ncbi:MAG TPA: hypothetical protein GX525_07005 [Bacilli bacterium]|nr:hypothetical protein [Bacilli bacterium]
MKNKQPLAPYLSSLQTGNFYLEDEAAFSDFYIHNEDHSYSSAANVILRSCHVERMTLQNVQLERFDCSNVIFEKCDLSNLEWMGGSFHQVIFRQCKLIGTNFAESMLRDCMFEDCVANMSSFSNTNLNTVTFSFCDLEESDFYDVTWKNLQLKKNSLTGSNWFYTKLSTLDLTTHTFEKIALSQELLKGLVVNTEQALVIALGLGIVIMD